MDRHAIATALARDDREHSARLAMTIKACLLESTLTMDTKQLHYTSLRPYRQKSIYL